MLKLLRGKKAAPPVGGGADDSTAAASMRSPSAAAAPGPPETDRVGASDVPASAGPADGAAGGVSYASQATAALAAAAASDGAPRGKRPPGAGRPISGADVVCQVDQLLPGEGQEIPVQPITVLKTDFNLAHHRQVTANASYIVYGLRAGQLRCINKATAGRALYKGHAAPIADAAFFSPDSNLLASVSAAGDLFVRLVVEVEGSPLAAPVMRAALGAPPASGTARISWHPTEPRILAAASGGRVAMFMVPSEAAAPASEAADQVPLDPAEPSLELALPAGRAAAALAFSPAGDLLVTGDSDGGACVWVLDAAAAGGADGAPPPASLAWPPHGGDAVSAVCFLGQPASGEPALLVTGDATNRRLALWRLPGATALARGAPAELLQRFELASAGGPGDFFCHLAHSPRAQLLLLANARRKQVHVLHYRADAGSAGAEAFDYLATFSVKQPVLSTACGYEMSESEATPGLMEAQVQLYCMQPDAIQQYTVDPSACIPGDDSLPLAPAAAAAAVAALAAPKLAAAAESTEAPPAAPVPPETLPSPVRLLGKDAGASSGKDASPSPPPLPITLTQQPKQQQQQQQQQREVEAAPPAAPEPALATQGKGATGPTKQDAAVAAAADGAAAQEQQQQQQQQAVKQKKGKAAPSPEGLGSLAPPAAMPPLPTTLAAKAHPEKGAAAPSREASSSLQPAVAPTVAVMPLPPGPGDDASGGGAGPGGSDDLEEGEIPPHILASVPLVSSAGGAAAAAAAAEDAALLRRQVDRLLAGQAALAAHVRAEVSEGLRAGEAAIAARVEALVAKTLSKRAEDEKRRAKEAEKALALQISQANAALLAAVNKSVADAARDQARAALQSAAGTIAPALASALAPQLARAVGDALSREAPAAAAAAAESAVAAALRGGALQEAVASQFAAHVAPAVEAATRQMFGQVEGAFGAWMAEARQSASASGLAPVVSQLQAVVATLQRDVSEGQRQLVRMASSGGGGGGAATSAVAAAPVVKPRSRVSAALAARDYDGAFNAALSAASPELLLWTCRQVSPAQLAAMEPPPLSQVCLLSLVQQLGASLGPGPDADLRLDWLTEVAPLMEPGNPTIAPHLRGVLGSVMASLKTLAGQLPHTDPVGRKAKLAIHVVNSLLHQ